MASTRGIDRLGLVRFPWLTLSVFGITLITSLVGLISAPVLFEMQRTPDAIGSEWWRNGTALLFQDGGIAGTFFNLAFLIVIGTLAEQVINRGAWLILYCVGGLLAEVVAHFWQPVGAGNSVAICALTGALFFALWRDDSALPKFSAVLVCYWLAGLLATQWWPLLFIGLGAALLFQYLLISGRSPNRAGAIGILAVGLVLSIYQNIHGAALLIGIALAWLIRLGEA